MISKIWFDFLWTHWFLLQVLTLQCWCWTKWQAHECHHVSLLVQIRALKIGDFLWVWPWGTDSTAAPCRLGWACQTALCAFQRVSTVRNHLNPFSCYHLWETPVYSPIKFLFEMFGQNHIPWDKYIVIERQSLFLNSETVLKQKILTYIPLTSFFPSFFFSRPLNVDESSGLSQ